MGTADRIVVDSLRDLYRYRYREPCLLPGHEILALYNRALSDEWVRDSRRMALRLMRRVDTGFEV
jgi:hypothetical protein